MMSWSWWYIHVNPLPINQWWYYYNPLSQAVWWNCHHFASVGSSVVVVTFNKIFWNQCQLGPNFVGIFIYYQANFYHFILYAPYKIFFTCAVCQHIILYGFKDIMRLKWVLHPKFKICTLCPILIVLISLARFMSQKLSSIPRLITFCT